MILQTSLVNYKDENAELLASRNLLKGESHFLLCKINITIVSGKVLAEESACRELEELLQSHQME